MRYLLIPLIPLACALCACASTTPHWDSRFGVDTRTALRQQIADPAAGRSSDPVAGMDGRAARAAYERYLKAGPEAQQGSVMQGGAR